MVRKKTGVALNHIPFIAAYSSVLNRTIATASHIIGERDIPLFHHQGLNEQYFGSWEGKVVDTLREHPEFQQLIKDPANYKAQVNGGETFEQLGERAMKHCTILLRSTIKVIFLLCRMAIPCVYCLPC